MKKLMLFLLLASTGIVNAKQWYYVNVVNKSDVPINVWLQNRNSSHKTAEYNTNNTLHPEQGFRTTTSSNTNKPSNRPIAPGGKAKIEATQDPRALIITFLDAAGRTVTKKVIVSPFNRYSEIYVEGKTVGGVKTVDYAVAYWDSKDKSKNSHPNGMYY